MRPQMKSFRFRNMSIRRKLMAITLIVAVLISAVALGGFQLVSHNYNNLVYSQTANALGVVADKIAARLDALMDISLYTAVNRDFQSNLMIINEGSSASVAAEARTEIIGILNGTFHSDLISISVVPLEASAIVVGSASFLASDGTNAGAIRLAEEAKGAAVWLSSGEGDGSILCARQIRNIGRPFLVPMGYLILRVNLNKVAGESAGEILTGEYTLSIRREGELLYPHVASDADIPDESVFRGDEPYAIDQEGNAVRFVTRSAIQAFKLRWDLVLGIPYEDVFLSYVVANASFIAAILVAILIAMLLSRRMLDSINQNIRLLTLKMSHVQKGELEPYYHSHVVGEDELGTLNRQFDKMTADFKQVIEDNYVKELLLTETQLKALEQQLNPHFLFNALDTIKWFARRGEGQNVAIIAQALGQLLRSTLSVKEDLIPLRRELATLDSYLSIQRIRFSSKLRVEIRTDEDARDVLIPKMSIQPLVENAIVHALEENIGECNIFVGVTLSDDMISVTVENDGSEIDVSVLEKLRSKTLEPKRNGIGLINIDSRIKLLFGQEYGLSLENESGKVRVSFRIPANYEEADGKDETPC